MIERIYMYINCTCIFTLIMKGVCEISMIPTGTCMCFDTRVAPDVKYVVRAIVLTLKYNVFNKKC